jgi:NAD(P)H-dependent flavin oxidoreductase YrpB (nitropropane dioxygenase family)
MKVLGLTGSVRNAARQVKAGVDIVVAQGTEAGGHTGRIATLPLIPSTIDAVAPTPVLAAGGIVDGRGIAAALTLGAAGVWLGTAFLVADECGLPDQMKDALVAGRASDFRISEAWTGKTVRSQQNVISQAWEEAELETLPTPHQRVLMEDFLESAKAAKRWDLFMNAAGQGAGALSRRRPAAEIMSTLVEDTIAALTDVANEVQFAH